MITLYYISTVQIYILVFDFSSTEGGGERFRNRERGDVSLGLFCWISFQGSFEDEDDGDSQEVTSGLGEQGFVLLVDGVGMVSDALKRHGKSIKDMQGNSD